LQHFSCYRFRLQILLISQSEMWRCKRAFYSRSAWSKVSLFYNIFYFIAHACKCRYLFPVALMHGWTVARFSIENVKNILSFLNDRMTWKTQRVYEHVVRYHRVLKRVDIVDIPRVRLPECPYSTMFIVHCFHLLRGHLYRLHYGSCPSFRPSAKFGIERSSGPMCQFLADLEGQKDGRIMSK